MPDSLGDRMKLYESAFQPVLPRRMPVPIRVDGRAFHSLTRHAVKPFDERLMSAMDAVGLALCREIQGAQIAYLQSDECTVLVHGYRTLTSQPWVNNELNKMVSLSASIATGAFNRAYVVSEPLRWLIDQGVANETHDSLGTIIRYSGLHPVVEYVPSEPAQFDSRAFCVPEDDVCNLFLWRQNDASRNSVQMVARAHFSHREVNGKSCSSLQDMLHEQKGINWNDLATRYKRGRCVVRREFDRDGAKRSEWVIDNEIPIFSQDRGYIERHVYAHREEPPCKPAS